MKRVGISFTFLIMLIGFSVSARGALVDMHDGTIYDTDTQLSWLEDANYAQTSGYDADGRMSWDNVMAWATQLNYAGYSDWRLPSSVDGNGKLPGIAGRDVRTTEWGYLFYIALGNEQGQGIHGQYINSGPFINIQRGGYPLAYYWTSTEESSSRSHHYLFEEGLNGTALKTEELLVSD